MIRGMQIHLDNLNNNMVKTFQLFNLLLKKIMPCFLKEHDVSTLI